MPSLSQLGVLAVLAGTTALIVAVGLRLFGLEEHMILGAAISGSVSSVVAMSQMSTRDGADLDGS